MYRVGNRKTKEVKEPDGLAETSRIKPSRPTKSTVLSHGVLVQMLH